jgi:hypothetical protein
MKVPDLILEQYRLRELPAADAQRVEHLLSTDEALRRRFEALEQSDEEIARQYPAGWLAPRIRARLPPSPRLRRTTATGTAIGWRLPLVLAAAAVVVMLIVPRSAIVPEPGARPAVEDSADRIKGLKPALTVYRRTAAGSETLADGSVARAGDLLRLGYSSARRPYGIILSIDGRGLVTQHLPPAGDQAAPLVRDGITLLESSYELDEAPGVERFYFVTGDTPFSVAPIMEAARRASVPKLPAGGPRPAPLTLPIARELSQSTFSIQKEVKP